MATRDKICILGVRCKARVGVPEKERRRPQSIEIDAVLECDIRPAAKNDDFKAAVDYQNVERTVRSLAEGRPWRLIETLAEEIARALLRCDARILAVIVRAHKRPALMPLTRDVCVEIRRARRRASRRMD
ncbi:MAG: dihydroneopterin aldolase [Elusimicrobia bacterium]|nr:dihydroneopterin aldolase [Elusimicrobiota bacterium]